jgi:hypothetical protein
MWRRSLSSCRRVAEELDQNTSSRSAYAQTPSEATESFQLCGCIGRTAGHRTFLEQHKIADYSRKHNERQSISSAGCYFLHLLHQPCDVAAFNRLKDRPMRPM